MNNFERELIKECRCVLFSEDYSTFNDKDMLEALTVNEELKNLGFTLTPKDIIRLAKSANKQEVLDKVKDVYDLKGYRPMYPDFPNQVMNMDEATLRFHQIVHYFSTYGIEDLFGVEVKHGWLPDVEETEKTEKDTALLKSKIIQLTNENESYQYIKEHIINKNERWTIPEKTLVQHVLLNRPELISDVPFKENFITLLAEERNSIDKDTMKMVVNNNCKHAGDVLKLINKYHHEINGNLKKWEKRMFIKQLESYPIENFKENLAAKQDFSKYVLKEISYNDVSHSQEHKQIVAQLRNGELRSWESLLQDKIKQRSNDLLSFYSQQPGKMIRGLTELIRIGYNKEDIVRALKDKDFKVQTLIDNINKLSNPTYDFITQANEIHGRSAVATESEYLQAASICREILKNKMKTWDTPLKDKEVFIDRGSYDFNHSCLSMNDKDEEGGYIKSGLAFKLPDNANKLRLFLFWNNPDFRVDNDLHAYACKEGEYLYSVGWHGHYKNDSFVYSGDRTDSINAAEYIDVDLKSKEAPDYVSVRFHSYRGQPFKSMQQIYVGVMAVDKLNENVEQYNPQNLLFYHELKEDAAWKDYGAISLKDRYLRLFDKNEKCQEFKMMESEQRYSLEDYIKDLCEAQNCKLIHSSKDKAFADVIVKLDKAEGDRDVSLIDHNFFVPDNGKAKAEEKTQVEEISRNR